MHLGKRTMNLFELQDKINTLIYDAYENGADADDIAAMVVTTGDAFGQLNGDHWKDDRLELYNYFLDEADAEDDNLFY